MDQVNTDLDTAAADTNTAPRSVLPPRRSHGLYTTLDTLRQAKAFGRAGRVTDGGDNETDSASQPEGSQVRFTWKQSAFGTAVNDYALRLKPDSRHFSALLCSINHTEDQMRDSTFTLDPSPQQPLPETTYKMYCGTRRVVLDVTNTEDPRILLNPELEEHSYEGSSYIHLVTIPNTNDGSLYLCFKNDSCSFAVNVADKSSETPQVEFRKVTRENRHDHRHFEFSSTDCQ